MTIINKKKNSIWIGAIVIRLMAFFPYTTLYFQDLGMSKVTLSAMLIIYTLVLLYVASMISTMAACKIEVSEQGVKVDDFGQHIFTWQELSNVAIEELILPRAQKVQWLVLKTHDDQSLMTPKISALNQRIGCEGIPVCNLATYDVEPAAFIESIQDKIKTYCGDLSTQLANA